MIRIFHSLVLSTILMSIFALSQTSVDGEHPSQIKLLQSRVPTQAASNPAVPRRLTYQGILTASSGAPVADGNYGFTIELFDVLSGGTPAWSDSFTLQVAQGTFSAILGSGAPLDIVFDKSYYVQVTVTTGPAGLSYPLLLLPRAELTSAPYALGPWSPSDSNIFFKGGNVGIGVSNPLGTLSIASNGGFVSPTDGILMGMGDEGEEDRKVVVGKNEQNSVSFGFYKYDLLGMYTSDAYLSSIGPQQLSMNSDASIAFRAGQHAGWNGRIYFYTNTQPRATILTDGKFGIGTETPTNKLSVYGSADITGSVGIGIASPTNKLSVIGGADFSGNVGIGIASPTNKLSVIGSADFSGNVGIGVASPTNKLSVIGSADFSGNVGVGTTTPGERLTVAGSMEVGTGAGDYQHLRIGGGNSSGYIYGDYAKYQDVISIGYNYYTNGAGGYIIPNPGGATSRISMGFASIGMYTGGPNVEPNILGIFIDGFGRVGVGTASPGQKLSVAGNICYTGSIGACSDIRYKKNIITLSSSLEKISQLRGVTYDWRTDEFPEQNFSSEKQIGLIAQEVEKVYPEVVLTDAQGYKSIDYSHLTAALIEATKELKAEIAELKALVRSQAQSKSSGKKSLGSLK